MSRVVIFFVLACLVLGACVPNKRLVYLQKDEPKTEEVQLSDSAVRTYKSRFREYRLRPNDIISIRVASITPEEFNFIEKYEKQLGLIRKLNQFDQALQSGNNNQRVGAGSIDSGMQTLALDRQQTGFVLDEEGVLELPYVGKINLEGKTLDEAEFYIKKRLLDYFETPVVRIQLLNFHFTILGEVTNEGRYTTYDPNSTIIDAFVMAGNLTEFADRSKIKIIRKDGENTKIIYIDVLNEDLLAFESYFLSPNDIIIVPPLKARETRRYILPNSSTALSVFGSLVSVIVLIITLSSN